VPLPTTLPTDRERFNFWQNQAVDAWERAGRKGIVEAVTGAGKTHVAYRAIERLRKADRLYPLIVVPTIPLMSQWKSGLEREFPGLRVGFQGDGYKDDFATFVDGKPIDVIVSTIHSAVPSLESGLLDHACSTGCGKTMIVADECHHVLSRTAKMYPKVLKFPFDFRLGLSATVGPYEVEGLGRIIYEYTLKTAVEQGIIPPFDIVNIAVDLTDDERERYLKLQKEIGDLLKRVCQDYDLVHCHSSK
jgi:RNA polymerase primary sigma factor